MKPNTLAFKGKDIILLLICMLTGILFSSLISIILIQSGLMSNPETTAFATSDSIFTELHGLILLNHFGTFIVPAALFFWIRRSEWQSTFTIYKFPDLRTLIMITFIMLGSLYFVLYLYEWNKSLPLPDWAKSLESDAEARIKALLSNTSTASFFINLLIMAILPAIGEELIFRGILQNIFVSITHKPWISILLAATIFSAIHLQFEGFFPRLVLGFLLGYLYVVTRNIWVPIAGHLVNNAFQLILQYVTEWSNDVIINLEKIEVTWLHAIPSLIFTIWLCRYLYVICTRKFDTAESLSNQTDIDPTIL